MNKENTRVAFITNTPVKVVLNKDTFISVRNRTVVLVPRQKESFKVKILNDSIVRDLTIYSGNSFAYWSNIYMNFGLGLLVDKGTAKRYGYSKKVLVTMSNLVTDTLVFFPNSSRISIYNNNIKVTPLRLLFSHPGVEFTYERYIGKRFSAQLGAARLYNISFSEPSGSGYQYSLEGKYFDVKRVKKTVAYTSVEVGYFNIDISSLWSEYKTTSTSSKIVASYNGHKTFFYLIPKIGLQSNLGEILLIDFYLGIGVKHEQGHYLNTYSPYDTIDQDFWQAKPSFNLRIGLRF